MDMHISGSGTISAGEYDNISISGSGRLEGPIRCKDFKNSGASKCEGDIFAENISVSGAAKVYGSCTAKFEMKVSGSLKIEGNVQADNIKVSGVQKCTGAVKANKIKVSGIVTGKNIECEELIVSGGIDCDDLLNAENIEIKLNGYPSSIGSIGGSKIIITSDKKRFTVIKRLPLISKLVKSSRSNEMNIKDAIEGDEIALEFTTAKKVTGRVVAIGKGCEIDLVQYTEEVEISPEAKVLKYERI